MPNAKTPLALTHRLWRMLPAGPRRKLLSAATTAMAPHPDRLPPAVTGGLAVAGELSRPSGLGENARLMLSALQAMGVPAPPIDLGDPIARRRTPVHIPPPAMPLVIHVNAPSLPLALLRLPRALIRRRRVIGYWAWELPTMPKAWQAGLPFVHEIWAVSQFAADAIAGMLPKGGPVPLRVVPPPIAISPPRPSARGRADFGLPDGAVITLVSFSLASSLARKNPLAAIAAHRAAFGPRPDRILLLKIAHAELFPADFAQIREAARGLDNIRFETRILNTQDRDALTACADIVLSLHRSEGFGMVAAEAMLLGVPVIATAWSASMEFMDETSASLVAYRLVPAMDPRGVFEAPGAVWAEADVEDAATRLRALADNPDARHALGEAGRRMAQTRLGDAGLRHAVHALGLA